MSYALTWLPDVLEAAGLKVARVDGWSSRGVGDMGQVHGVICHHTAGPLRGNMPSLKTLIEGRRDLSGPLAQLGLGRDGTYYVIAAGRCNHAGKGSWEGLSSGNSSFIGIEAENTGLDEAWSDVQMDSYQRGVAAILKHLKQDEQTCAGHKEYALPHGRKNDPTFDMEAFRTRVREILDGKAILRPMIPALESDTVPGQLPRPTLRRGAVGDLVRLVQRACGADEDAHFGAKTEAAVREFQRRHELVADGIVGPKTWRLIDQALQQEQAP